LLAATVYLAVVGPYRNRFNRAVPVSWSKKAAFLFGLGVLYIAQGSPVDLLGHHYLFTAHMVQMALMYMVFPPLILLGIPDWIWERLLRTALSRKIVTVITYPLLTLFLFNGLFSFYHFPVLFDHLMASHSLHLIYHTLLSVAAFTMWWPILCPLPALDKLTPLRKIGYILSGSVLITPVCALVIFADSTIYETYAGVPQILPYLSTFHDQQLGGVLMKLIQEAAFGTGLLIIFVKWMRQEKSSSTVDPVAPVSDPLPAHASDQSGQNRDVALHSAVSQSPSSRGSEPHPTK
jgi:putative membrane protein